MDVGEVGRREDLHAVVLEAGEVGDLDVPGVAARAQALPVRRRQQALHGRAGLLVQAVRLGLRVLVHVERAEHGHAVRPGLEGGPARLGPRPQLPQRLARPGLQLVRLGQHRAGAGGRLELPRPHVDLLAEQRVQRGELAQAVRHARLRGGVVQPAVPAEVVRVEVGARALVELALPADRPGELGIGLDLERHRTHTSSGISVSATSGTGASASIHSMSGQMVSPARPVGRETTHVTPSAGNSCTAKGTSGGRLRGRGSRLAGHTLDREPLGGGYVSVGDGSDGREAPVRALDDRGDNVHWD